MDGYRLCREHQKQWALRKTLPLIGSKWGRGEPAYTTSLEANLLEPLSVEARRELEEGDGGELLYNGGPFKMQAVHSSAALTCNLFHYWRRQRDLRPLLTALGMPAEHGVSLEFEAKRAIFDNPDREVFKKDPNLDVVIHCAGGRQFREIAFECKFTEPYRPIEPRSRAEEARKKGLNWAYLKATELWEDLPECHRLGRRLSPADDNFKFLHAAQLIKHILGLKHRNGKTGFCLVYLWYDLANVESDARGEADAHRKEITEFAAIAAADGIVFRSVSCQEVIASLAQQRVGHEDYVDYLAERYA